MPLRRLTLQIKNRSCSQNILDFCFPGPYSPWQTWKVAGRAERGNGLWSRMGEAKEKKKRCSKNEKGVEVIQKVVETFASVVLKRCGTPCTGTYYMFNNHWTYCLGCGLKPWALEPEHLGLHPGSVWVCVTLGKLVSCQHFNDFIYKMGIIIVAGL